MNVMWVTRLESSARLFGTILKALKSLPSRLTPRPNTIGTTATCKWSTSPAEMNSPNARRPAAKSHVEPIGSIDC